MTNNCFSKILFFACFCFLMFHTEIVPGRLTVPEVFQVDSLFYTLCPSKIPLRFSLMKHQAGPRAGTDITGKRKQVPWNTSLPERIQAERTVRTRTLSTEKGHNQNNTAS